MLDGLVNMLTTVDHENEWACLSQSLELMLFLLHIVMEWLVADMKLVAFDLGMNKRNVGPNVHKHVGEHIDECLGCGGDSIRAQSDENMVNVFI